MPSPPQPKANTTALALTVSETRLPTALKTINALQVLKLRLTALTIRTTALTNMPSAKMPVLPPQEGTSLSIQNLLQKFSLANLRLAVQLNIAFSANFQRALSSMPPMIKISNLLTPQSSSSLLSPPTDQLVPRSHST